MRLWRGVARLVLAVAGGVLLLGPCGARFLLPFCSIPRVLSAVVVVTYFQGTGKTGAEKFAATSAYARVRLLCLSPCACFRPSSHARQGLRWLVAYALVYPFSLCCLVVVKLLVLHRLFVFCKLDVHTGSAGRWPKVARVALAVVVLGSVIGCCGNIAASVSFLKAAELLDTIDASRSLLDSADDAIAEGATACSVHIAFETALLLLVVVTISFVGAASARRIQAALHALLQQAQDHQEFTVQHKQTAATISVEENRLKIVQQAIDQGRRLRLHVVTTCSAIFLSFLLRAVYTTIFTVASALQDSSITCSGYTNRCSSCYNVYSQVVIWLLHTPSFHYR
jgi:Tfp pilus assembly protein PilE